MTRMALVADSGPVTSRSGLISSSYKSLVKVKTHRSSSHWWSCILPWVDSPWTQQGGFCPRWSATHNWNIAEVNGSEDHERATGFADSRHGCREAMEGRCVEVVFGCKQRSSEGQKWPVLHLGVIRTKRWTYKLQLNSESKAKLNKGAEVERKLEMQRGKALKVLYPAVRRHRSNTRQFGDTTRYN